MIFVSLGEGTSLSFSMLIAELVGGCAVYLTTQRAKYLNGKSASVNWDVEELETRREGIVSKGVFMQGLKGQFSSVNCMFGLRPAGIRTL